MQEARDEPAATLDTLKTVGHATPRIDALERVTGRATYTGDVHLARHAVRARAPQSASARAHPQDRRLEGAGAARRQGHPHARELHGGLGRGLDRGRSAVQRRDQEDHQAATVCVQQSGALRGRAGRGRGGGQSARRRRRAAAHPVDYEVLPFVLDPEEALKPGRVQIWPEGNLSLNAQNEAKPEDQRGNVEEGFRTADHVFEDRYTTTFVHNAQMEPRSCVAHWEGDKLTVYTPTGGIANCRHDMARDLGIPDEKVRVICQYMGGNFGNKNQNQDADLITAMLAKQAGAPVKLELSRKEDFIGMHGRWPTIQYYKVGVSNDGTLQAHSTARLQRHGRVPQELGRHGGIEVYQCPNIETTVHPVYTNKTVSGNFRGPEFPQGYFGIQSMMDDVAYKMKMDPVEFVLKNMTRKANDAGRVHQLHAGRVHPPRRGGVRVEEALASAAGLGCGSGQARRGHVVHGVPIGSGPQQRDDSAWIRRASTPCTSASPTSARAPRPPWA